MRLNLHQVLQNINQHLGRALVGINLVYQFLAVKIQNRPRFSFVGFKTIPDDVYIGIIETIFLERTALQPFHELVDLRAAQVKNAHNGQSVRHDLRLRGIPGNAIKDQGVFFRMEASGPGAVLDKFVPELDGGFVGHEFAAAGVIKENFADFAVVFQASENVSAGAMEKTWDSAKNLALGAFASSGGAK